MFFDLLGALVTDPGGLANAVGEGIDAGKRRQARERAEFEAQAWLEREKAFYLWKKEQESKK